MKKNILKIIIPFMLAFLIIGGRPVQAEEGKEEFEIEYGTLIGYNGNRSEVVIPEGVESINTGVFEGNTTITSVVLPESVTYIGENAFYDCIKLEKVVFPSKLPSIASLAFDNTLWMDNLRKVNPLVIIDGVLIDGKASTGAVTIPKNVTIINDSSFAGNSSMTSISIPDSVTNIGPGAFWSCSKIKSITLPESVKHISRDAFASCSSLRSVTFLGDTLFSEGVFDNCDPELILYGLTSTYSKELAKEYGYQTQDLAFNKSKASIEIGKTTTLTMNNAGKVTGWKSSNTKVATVKNGKVTAISTGKATITGKYNGKSYQCVITVKEPSKDGYLTKKQLTDKINTLIKKYPKVDKKHIKIRVIGANLDYIDDKVLFSILNISDYTKLKKYADDYYKAMDKSFETAFFTRAHNALGHPKPDYLFSEDVRISDLFFDKNLIKQGKYFDSLLKDMTDYKKRETATDAGVNLLGYFFDHYYSEYFDYLRGETYKFGDENVGEAASYAINYYSIKVMLEVELAEFYYYAPFKEAEDAEAEVKEYVDNQVNPFISRMNSIKKRMK